MTHPVFHAQSTARTFGGDWQSYMPIHQWLDETKSSFTDFRHRSLRHHRQGVDLLIELGIQGTLDRSTAKAVAEQHIIEDCGRIPDITDFINEFRKDTDVMGMPFPVIDTQMQCDLSAKKFGGCSDDYIHIHQWFDEGIDQYGKWHHFYRHHSDGIFAAEKQFGLAITLGNGKIVPTRYIGEHHVRNDLGAHPSVCDYLRHMTRQPFMAKTSFVA
jgi:hypothetical protein